jgi:hypothetical protein
VSVAFVSNQKDEEVGVAEDDEKAGEDAEAIIPPHLPHLPHFPIPQLLSAITV